MKPTTIDELLAGLGQHLGMPGLALNHSGCCQLVFDQRWLVTLIYQGSLGRIALNCPVSAAHSASYLSAAALLAMLQANFMGRGTGRCQLAICPEGRACLQMELALAETDSSVLVHAMDQLLNQAESWTQWFDSKASSAVAKDVETVKTVKTAFPPAVSSVAPHVSAFVAPHTQLQHHHHHHHQQPLPVQSGSQMLATSALLVPEVPLALADGAATDAASLTELSHPPHPQEVSVPSPLRPRDWANQRV